MAHTVPPIDQPARSTTPRLPTIWATGVCRPRDQARTRLVSFAQPAMENLQQQLNSDTVAVTLSDERGHLLSLVGADTRWLDAARDWSSKPQPDPSPSDPKTTLASSSPAVCAVPYPSALRVTGLSVTAINIPILGVNGGSLGVVEFSRLADGGQAHVSALIENTAAIIEHRLIETDERGYLWLHFHHRRAMLGSPLEALVSFNQDRQVLSHNRIARALVPARQAGDPNALATMFTPHWQELLSHAQPYSLHPFTLQLDKGSALHAAANVRPQRSSWLS